MRITPACGRSLALCLISWIIPGCVVISPELKSSPAMSTDYHYQHINISGFEYQSDMRQVIKDTLRDTHLAATVNPASRLTLQARIIDARHDTDSMRITWNVINSALLLFLFSSPYLGSSVAESEINVFYNDQLISTYTAKSRTYWRFCGFAFLPRAREGGIKRAKKLALQAAIEKIAAQPPPLPDAM